jgi:polyisoprenoid-binding protein YceI
MAVGRIPDESGLAQNYLLDSSDLAALDLVRNENTSQDTMVRLMTDQTKSSYQHDEVYGQFCALSQHIEAPYDLVFEYCANIRSVTEWTYSVRDLSYLGGGLYKARDTIQPDTDIFIRSDAQKGEQHGTIVHSCAWDQGLELWMRYYLTLIDSSKTLNRPGTLVLWANFRHPYYDADPAAQPGYITAGQARTDRMWVGEIWPMFHAAHSIEISNMKRILEHRVGGLPATRPPAPRVSTPTVDIPGYAPGVWEIDPVHSDISFAVRHLGVARVRGRFDGFSGTVVTADDPMESTVTATIDAATFNSGNQQRDGHVRSPDFLDAQNHEALTFRSTGLRLNGDNYLLDGELTLRGITRPLTLDLKFHGVSDHPMTGGQVIGFSASTTIRRKDFGVTGGQAGAVVGEKIKITLEIEAVKKD